VAEPSPAAEPRPRPAPVSLDPWWRKGASRGADAARGLSAAAGGRWRRSLRMRVVGSTVIASALVVGLFVSLLVGQVGRGLVAAKTRSALVEASTGLQAARGDVERAGATGQAASVAVLEDVVQRLSDRGATGDLYTVVLAGPDDSTSFTSPGLRPADVPAALRDRLQSEPGPLYVFAPVPGPGGNDTGLVVGSTLGVPALGQYRLYHLFPLDAERQTLSLVRRTAAVAGSLLVLLVALVALLVTRQVVSPVRMAARTAERLAAGRLEERMRVSGEDELARLASSFNSMAEALQSQIRQLEDLSRVQRRFVSDVSHELRTPLTTVRMAADVLFAGRTRFPPEVARSAELLQDELDRFEALLADLLEISRYDAGAAALDAAPLDVVRLLDRAVAAAAPLAERKGSAIDLSGVPAGPVVVEADAVRLERVLRNLLVNAVEHGEGRPVEVTVASDDDAVAVLVRDHGVGLQPGQAGMVFTRFWRADPSRARSTGGTGLGLAISLEDVRLHGGWLQAAGMPGEGAAFLVTLPARAGRPLGDGPLALPWATSRRPASEPA
jgi:two-component system, OmpR family, sensor histidine kinase MtrB